MDIIEKNMFVKDENYNNNNDNNNSVNNITRNLTIPRMHMRITQIKTKINPSMKHFLHKNYIKHETC